MKRLRSLALMALGVMTLALSFSSCSDDDDNDYWKMVPNALVTVKPISDGCYFQLDDNTTLKPGNINKKPFGDNGGTCLGQLFCDRPKGRDLWTGGQRELDR